MFLKYPPSLHFSASSKCCEDEQLAAASMPRAWPNGMLLILLPLHAHGAIATQHAAVPLRWQLRVQPMQHPAAPLLRQLRVQRMQLRMVGDFLTEKDEACPYPALRDGEICWEPLEAALPITKPDSELPLNESWSPLRAASLRFARVRKVVNKGLQSPLLLLPAFSFSWWLLPTLSNLEFFQRMHGLASQVELDSLASVEGAPLRAFLTHPVSPQSSAPSPQPSALCPES